MKMFGKRNAVITFVIHMALQGVAILMPYNFDVFLTVVSHDNYGHILLLDCTIEENNFILVSK